jgi:hypothetical protein
MSGKIQHRNQLPLLFAKKCFFKEFDIKSHKIRLGGAMFFPEIPTEIGDRMMLQHRRSSVNRNSRIFHRKHAN